MREFETGATRDTEDNKIDYWGFISPLAMRSFGEYMMKHQIQADGQKRASDNWKKGIPMDTYIRSLFRHMMDFKRVVDGPSIEHMEGYAPDEAVELANAMLFNIQGWLHEAMKARREEQLAMGAQAGSIPVKSAMTGKVRLLSDPDGDFITFRP